MDQNYLWIERLKFNEAGLVPAIAQDYQDSFVLMMAWMSRESIQRTLETGEAHYWSRSRAELWH
ncbi:phosphoribosyl-AMP cyclohydrolase, partial [Leptolyngbya sp. FACHB-1624]|uniref:phosphoribosyl-AMP cyclohydrolase n=1 Tax=Leptolyngbya sp. FACHB-1624 TaxID=2692802 RepID=UPI0019896F8C|nr:phosphoribosyl-AMP cyclohydrolase [Leptolyngbya sp. FACHB-1624]